MLFSLFDVCDKCNDFVFHYLLDYSCRVLLVDSVLILILKKPLISFNVCVCRKFVRTCSILQKGLRRSALRSRPGLFR